MVDFFFPVYLSLYFYFTFSHTAAFAPSDFIWSFWIWLNALSLFILSSLSSVTIITVDVITWPNPRLFSPALFQAAAAQWLVLLWFAWNKSERLRSEVEQASVRASERAGDEGPAFCRPPGAQESCKPPCNLLSVAVWAGLIPTRGSWPCFYKVWIC